MIPEIGHLSLILALSLALPLALVPLLGAAKGRLSWMLLARPLACGQFVFIALSFVCLIYAFVTNDFSVSYVAKQSHTTMPLYYKVSAIWGAHEGSMLLWLLMLAGWTFAVALFSRNLPLDLVARVLSVMGLVSVGFLLFALLTSNPFERLLLQTPLDGSELNPLLQDFGQNVHPPMLYMGYVGFSVAFAFAIAALIGGKLDAAWARWSRPWTNIAWVFLTLGICMGSYWAYYELGWGGWWVWDPVENASFLPWLVGTALIHSLAVTDKRGAFKSWTVLLAIFAFSLSLLGAFLVRSGVLESVHSFAVDPRRGLFLLVFLLIAIGGSLTLYAIRAPAVVSKPVFDWWSREVLLLANNLLLVVGTVIVLIGTLAPLFASALGVTLSVGEPYFNMMFVPPMCVLLALLGFAAGSKWKRSSALGVHSSFLVALVASLLLGLLFPALYGDAFEWKAALGLVLALWVVFTLLADLAQKVRLTGKGIAGLGKLSRGYLGMQCAHFGMAVLVIGISFTSAYSERLDLRMAPGESAELAGYRFRYEGFEQVQGHNYMADRGRVRVYQGDKELYLMQPEKRFYPVSGQVMTEAAIDTGFTRDLYVVMGEQLDGQAWSLRLNYYAFVDWIWFGGIFMACGGLLALSDRRYRVKVRHQQAELVGEQAELIRKKAPKDAPAMARQST